jgi:eukaryotic-like serine/threonine-protein kinase
VSEQKRDTGRGRLEAVFLRALELPTVDREDFLRVECSADPELIPAIREMLDGERRTRGASAWTRPVWEMTSLRFGPYRVTGRIGSGGMGVVYEAVRDDDEFRKRVAIKTISPALLTDYAARKLRGERQILAELEHRYIARLLDGGTTPEGLPYVVMEYIEGEPVTVFAESHGLDTAARLHLFLKICEAVEFAHSNLVVHADLKPANILVARDGTPKLLDFGLARLMGGATTILGATPDYASPEQLSGAPVTTASDVYSLGVLLHELLTGTLPERGGRSGGRGDLDDVGGMALEPDPAQRYRSVSALADDIQRFLNHYPVVARRQSFRYRAGKYVRRNRLLVAATSLVIATAIAGVTANYRQSRRTQRHFEEVRTLSHALLFDTYDAIAELPGATAARKSVVALANEYLDRLAADPNADTALRKDLAVSYRRLGEIRGWPYLANLGDTRGALENFRRSAALLESCLRERPGDASAQFELAKTENGIGVILVREGNPYEAETWQTRAVARVKTLTERQPRDTTYRQELANSELYLGQALYIRGTRERQKAPIAEAMRHYTEAMRLRTELRAETPTDAEAIYQVGRAAIYSGYAHWALAELHDAGDHYASARLNHEQGLAAARTALALQPQNGRYARDVLDAEADLAQSLWYVGEKSAALATLRKLIDVEEPRVRAERDNREAQFDYAQLCDRYAGWLLASGDLTAALRWTRRTFEWYERIAAADPDNEELADRTIALHDRLGDAFLARRQPRAAAAEYRNALRVAERLHSPTAKRFQAEQRAKLDALTN